MRCRRPHCQRQASIRGLCRTDYFRATMGQDAEIAHYLLDAYENTPRWDPGVVLVCECDHRLTNKPGTGCAKCGRLVAHPDLIIAAHARVAARKEHR